MLDRMRGLPVVARPARASELDLRRAEAQPLHVYRVIIDRADAYDAVTGSAPQSVHLAVLDWCNAVDAGKSGPAAKPRGFLAKYGFGHGSPSLGLTGGY